MQDINFNTNQFLSAIWDGLEGKVVIAKSANKEDFGQFSYQSNEINKITSFIEDHKRDNHLYFTPYLFKTGSRTKDNVKSGRCLFVDIDSGDGNHNSNNLPYPTKRETLATITSNYDKIGIPPSFIIDSGGGYHCYWLLDEDIVSTHTQDEVAHFNESIFQLGLNETDRATYFNERKDVSSLLRIPGSYNLKNNGRIEVKLINCNAKRYSFAEEIQPLLPKFSPGRTKLQNILLSDTCKIIPEKIAEKLKRFKDGKLLDFITIDTLRSPINSIRYKSHSEKEMGIIYYLMYNLKLTPEEIKYIFDRYVSNDFCHYSNYNDDSVNIDYIIRIINKYNSDDRYSNRLLGRKYPFVKLYDNSKSYKVDKQTLVTWFNENEITRILDECITLDHTDRLWSGNLWKVSTENKLKNYTHKSFKDKGIDLLSDCVKELYNQISFVPFQKREVSTNFRKKFVISFLNGSLEIYPSENGQKKFQFLYDTWNKTDYCTFQIQENYADWMIKEDRWIDTQVGDYFKRFYKEECLSVIQMFLSGVFIPGFNIEKVLLIIGKAGSGKGTIVESLSKLFDRDSVSNLPISMWAVTHGNLSLMNSVVNISNETSSRKIPNDIFKSVVDQSPITFNPKYEKIIEMPVKAKHLITINEFPKMLFGDSEKRRYVLIQTIKSIPQYQQDPKYKEEFIQNRIYLLNFMLRGIDKLIDNNFMIEYQDEELLSELIEESDTIVPFVENYLVYSEGDKVAVSDIYKEFETWKRDKDYIKPVSPPLLMRRIYRILSVKEEFTGYKKGKRKGHDRGSHVINVRLANALPSKDDDFLDDLEDFSRCE